MESSLKKQTLISNPETKSESIIQAFKREFDTPLEPYTICQTH